MEGEEGCMKGRREAFLSYNEPPGPRTRRPTRGTSRSIAAARHRIGPFVFDQLSLFLKQHSWPSLLGHQSKKGGSASSRERPGTRERIRGMRKRVRELTFALVRKRIRFGSSCPGCARASNRLCPAWGALPTQTLPVSPPL